MLIKRLSQKNMFMSIIGCVLSATGVAIKVLLIFGDEICHLFKKIV